MTVMTLSASGGPQDAYSLSQTASLQGSDILDVFQLLFRPSPNPAHDALFASSDSPEKSAKLLLSGTQSKVNVNKPCLTRMALSLEPFWTIFAFGNRGGFRAFQDQFLGDFAHLFNDFVQGPLVGNGLFHFFGFSGR